MLDKFVHFVFRAN